MFTLTRIPSFSAAGDRSAFFGRHTIGIATPPSAVAKIFDLSECRYWEPRLLTPGRREGGKSRLRK